MQFLTIIKWSLIAGSFAGGIFGAAATAQAGETQAIEPTSTAKLEAVVHYCSDGDTCHIELTAGKLWLNVRLFGIDAPETEKSRFKKKGQPLGDSAREFLNSLVKGKTVLVDQADLDTYNRPIVELYLNGQSINVTLVENGLAEVYRGKTKRIDRKKFELAETKAKMEKKGIWAIDNYQSPKDFRRGQSR